MERLVLRHRVVCTGCGSRLPPRSDAWRDEALNTYLCPSCYHLEHPDASTGPAETRGAEVGPEETVSPPAQLHEPWDPWKVQPPNSPEAVACRSANRSSESDRSPVSSVRAEPAPPARGPSRSDPPVEADVPAARDASADGGPRAEHDRRAQPGERARRSGAATDPITGVLDAAGSRGLRTLHHRTIPGTDVAIDHLVVSPNGIWLVVDQPEPDGRVERRDVGDWFTPEPRFFVGETDRTAIVVRTRAIDAAIGKALSGALLESVPRYRMICFTDALPGWMDRPFPFDDVWITWSRHLVEPMLATTHLAPQARAEIYDYLDEAAPPR